MNSSDAMHYLADPYQSVDLRVFGLCIFAL